MHSIPPPRTTAIGVVSGDKTYLRPRITCQGTSNYAVCRAHSIHCYDLMERAKSWKWIFFWQNPTRSSDFLTNNSWQIQQTTFSDCSCLIRIDAPCSVGSNVNRFSSKGTSLSIRTRFTRDQSIWWAISCCDLVRAVRGMHATILAAAVAPQTRSPNRHRQICIVYYRTLQAVESLRAPQDSPLKGFTMQHSNIPSVWCSLNDDDWKRLKNNALLWFVFVSEQSKGITHRLWKFGILRDRSHWLNGNLFAATGESWTDAGYFDFGVIRFRHKRGDYFIRAGF